MLDEKPTQAISLKRVVCQSEDCNKSFYTYYISSIQCCPYCKGTKIEDYAPENKFDYRIEACDKPKVIIKQLYGGELSKG